MTAHRRGTSRCSLWSRADRRSGGRGWALVYSPFWATVLLGIGVGAILQVVVEVGRLITRSQARHDEPVLTWTTMRGVTAGVAVISPTALPVAA